MCTMSQQLLMLILLFVTGCSAGEYCLSSGLFGLQYCSGYCCGVLNTECCSFSIGLIVGAVIGGIIGLVFLILFIICIVKSCSKSGSSGRVVHPQTQIFHTQPNMNPGYNPYYGKQGPPPPYTSTVSHMPGPGPSTSPYPPSDHGAPPPPMYVNPPVPQASAPQPPAGPSTSFAPVAPPPNAPAAPPPPQ